MKLDETKRQKIIHPIPPLYDKDSKILILGSFPSVKSREEAFFYGHKQNRFWKLLAGILSEKKPETVEEKKDFLHRNCIAVWDVIHSCDIIGSSDSSIRNVVPNDLSEILESADIRQIYCNGAKSYEYYRKYQEKETGRKAKKLPSTSPANAAFSIEKLTNEWKEICGPLQVAPAGIGGVLLNWYDYNARILPWRSDPTPYHVWISEIMLQQTRVEAVKPYFQRFIQELPDVAALAAAPEERIIKLWEGLGYYSRVRNMQKAAIQVMEEYDGRIPEDFETLLSLKGIGRYTAGAIASIAYGKKVPAVDGNVLRVYTRLTENHEDIMKQSVRKSVENDLTEQMSEDRPGDFNQAMMELGAVVCVPNGAAKCEECPLGHFCLARKHGTVEELPVKAPKKARTIEQRTILVIQDGASTAIRKRPDTGLLAGLYELPNVEGHLTEKAALARVKAMGLEPLRIEALPDAKHIFSHIEWRMCAYRIAVSSLEEAPQGEFLFVDKRESDKKYAIPSAFRAYTRYMKEENT